MGELGTIKRASYTKALSAGSNAEILGTLYEDYPFWHSSTTAYDFYDDEGKNNGNRTSTIKEHRNCYWLAITMHQPMPEQAVLWALALQPVKASSLTYRRIGLLAIYDRAIYQDATRRIIILV